MSSDDDFITPFFIGSVLLLCLSPRSQVWTWHLDRGCRPEVCVIIISLFIIILQRTIASVHESE